MSLVQLADAKVHLHVTDPARDVEIQGKADHASAVIVDYLKEQADPAWTADTAPLVVQAAVLLMLGHLWEHRGDDLEAPTGSDAAVWEAIARLLMRMRDPALA